MNLAGMRVPNVGARSSAHSKEKQGLRQSDSDAREGIELSGSTMAAMSVACAATLTPLYELIKTHVFAAERGHGDDTTVPPAGEGEDPHPVDLDLCP
jgi:hypothetical protein